jgi:prophage regulatory protein
MNRQEATLHAQETTPQRVKRTPPQTIAVATDPDALLKPPTTAELMGLSIITLYRKCRDDASFPKPVKLGKRCTRWKADEVRAWLQAQK